MSDFSILRSSNNTPRPSSDSTIIGRIEHNQEGDRISVRSTTSTLRNSSLGAHYRFAHPYSGDIVSIAQGIAVTMCFTLINLLEALPKEKKLSTVYAVVLAVQGLVELGLYVTFKTLETHARATANERQPLLA